MGSSSLTILVDSGLGFDASPTLTYLDCLVIPERRSPIVGCISSLHSPASTILLPTALTTRQPGPRLPAPRPSPSWQMWTWIHRGNSSDASGTASDLSGPTSPARFDAAPFDRRSSLSLRSSATNASRCWILPMLLSPSTGGEVANSSNLMAPMLYSSCNRSCSATTATTACHLQTLSCSNQMLLTLVQPLAGMAMPRTNSCLVDEILQTFALGRLCIQRGQCKLQLGQLRRSFCLCFRRTRTRAWSCCGRRRLREGPLLARSLPETFFC